MKNKLAFVSVNYNTAEKYNEFLQSLSNMLLEQVSFKVVIVDNASLESDVVSLIELVNVFSKN